MVMFPFKSKGDTLLLDVEMVRDDTKVGQEKIAFVAGISAIGYFPIWRVGLTSDGIELGMPQLPTGLLPYHSIQYLPSGFKVVSKYKNVLFTLTVLEQPALCALSKQWYPYGAKFEVLEGDQMPHKYNGIAMSKGQKPLPPHPDKGAQPIGVNGIRKLDVYKMLDQVKFHLMNEDFLAIQDYLNFPVIINGVDHDEVCLKDIHALSRLLLSSNGQVYVQKIIKCRYDDLIEDNGVIRLADSLIELKHSNGQMLISSFNRF